MVEFSRLSSFWAISAIVDRVSQDVVVVEGVGGLGEVTDGVGDEKLVFSFEISLVIALVVPIFVFFLLSVSAGDCNMSSQVE